MDIRINDYELMKFPTQHNLVEHLWTSGLDISKPVYVKSCPFERCNVYSGEARPDPIDRIVRTCIGLVPITKSWEKAA